MAWADKRSNHYKRYVGSFLKGNQYVRCQWCDYEIRVNSLYGKRGHLNSDFHKEKERLYVA